MTTQSRIEPDLYRLDVPEDRWAQLDGTGLESATIGDGDDYTVRDKDRPAAEIRRAGDEWRKLAGVLGRGAPAEEAANEDLHDLDVDDDAFRGIDGTGLMYARLNDHDAYAVRDVNRPGVEIRLHGNDWRKFGMVV